MSAVTNFKNKLNDALGSKHRVIITNVYDKKFNLICNLNDLYQDVDSDDEANALIAKAESEGKFFELDAQHTGGFQDALILFMYPELYKAPTFDGTMLWHI
jgi:hypothetical protein